MTDLEIRQKESYNVKRTVVLFSRFETYWSYKWKEHVDAVSLDIALEEWGDAIQGLPDNAIKEALRFCKMNLAWPPSIAEFMEIAERQQGVPSSSDVMRLGINRDFSHPLTQKIFEMVGSWAFTHDSEKILSNKVKAAYQEAIGERRSASNLVELGATLEATKAIEAQ